MIPITRFEMTKLIGIRAEQLARGAVPTIDPIKLNIRDPLQIAYKEVEQGTIPLMIQRVLPNGHIVQIKIKPK